MTNEEKKERIRERIRVQVDGERYRYYPETIRTDHYKSDEYQRVAVYVRVSTDDYRQTTSFELQRQYYEEFVRRHEKWELVKIYADEGISGTSRKHRDAFNQMIADARNGKIDLIITKSVSRFARNVEDFLSSVRSLSEHNPPVGVFFESENIYSLKEDSSMALSFQATMAEEESRNKSRSMETSLRMRLDHGLPLTPKLLGYTHDENGKLIPDPESCRIPKLMFCMCLYGYSTQQIADKLTALGKKTYLGNVKWTAGGVIQTLRNERYCGDVFTRKTFTRDVLSHKSVKNRGERPRSRYLDEHEPIISRDDFVAVQHLLNNAKYRNRSLLPELQVISEGLLQGFVLVNPRWGAFTEEDYRKASASIGKATNETNEEQTIEAEEGDFDFSGYEIARMDPVTTRGLSVCTLDKKYIQFNMECIKRMAPTTSIEILIHPEQRKLAIRPATPGTRHAILWSKKCSGDIKSRPIAASAFGETLLKLFDWDTENRYRLFGTHYKHGQEETIIFTADGAGVLIRESHLRTETAFIPLNRSGRRIGAISGDMTSTFGKDFYEEQSADELVRQTPENWKIRLEGKLCSIGQRLKITPYEELKAFIQEELGELFWEDEHHGRTP